MKTMRKTATFGLFLVLAVFLSAHVLWVQGQKGEHQQAGGHDVEVFCTHSSTGQLCLRGTPQVLKLDGIQKDRWNEIARRYNKAAAAATKQFLEEAKTTLSPQQFAMVEKWFDESVNEQLNRQVLAAMLADQ